MQAASSASSIASQSNSGPLPGAVGLGLRAAREAFSPCWAWLLALAVPVFGYPVLTDDPQQSADPLTEFAHFSPLLKGIFLSETTLTYQDLDLGLALQLVLGSWLTAALVAWRWSHPGWPSAGPRQTLASLKRAGRGLFGGAFGLLLGRMVLGSLALLCLASLPIGFAAENVDLGILDGPLKLLLLGIFALGMLYVLTLDAACWLGLQSLAANRRGSGSAFQHAWRLLSNDPAKATRAVGVYALVIGVGYGGLLPFLIRWIGDDMYVAFLLAAGWLGWWSTLYWQHAYVSLGGIRTYQDPLGGSPGLGDGEPAQGS
jgi:hypothetical protein